VSVGQSVTLTWPSLRLNLKLDVAEVLPNERLVFVVGPSRLTIDVDDGQILLTHEGLRTDDEEDGTRSAWRASLSLLAHSLAHHRGRERQVRWITRSIKTSAPIAHLFYTQPAALGQWLTRSGEIGPEGSEVNLHLYSGERVTGEVLANTKDRDVALSWREQGQSCLVLRSFPSPSEPDERLLALSWSLWGAKAFPDATLKHLEHAFDRLTRTLNNKGNA
jgi:hypothetical protein